MVEKAGFRHSRGLREGVVGQCVQALLIDDLQGGLDELRFLLVRILGLLRIVFEKYCCCDCSAQGNCDRNG